MLIDLDRCIGCQACAVACKAEHGVRLGGFRSWVSEREVGRYPAVKREFLPSLCNHCENPACLDVCPTGATFKRSDGIVDIDKTKCIGCRHCMGACPYNARYFNPGSDREAEVQFPSRTGGTVDKCDFCAHRVDSGVTPACVNTCPSGARIFGDLDDPESEIARLHGRREVRSLLPRFGTRPNVLYVGGDVGIFETNRRRSMEPETGGPARE
jgi:tetrathionate reductase subunit B